MRRKSTRERAFFCVLRGESLELLERVREGLETRHSFAKSSLFCVGDFFDLRRQAQNLRKRRLRFARQLR